MSAPTPADRYHALDSLRGFAMFLGVLLHIAISFMSRPPAFWPVRDTEPTPLADVFLLAVHDFRMQLFFLLAGLFGCLLYQRYGTVGMLRHRIRRVAIPFALALVFVVPTVQAVSLFAEIENVRAVTVRGERSGLRDYAAGLIAANPDATTGQLLANYFLTGESLARLIPVHLWFLYYLLFFYAAVVILTPLLSRLTGSKFLAGVDAAFRWVVKGNARVLVPAVLTFPLMLGMRWIVDTPTGWSPQWHVLGYYFWFFAFGWMLYRNRDLVVTFGRGWKLNLLVANVVVLPAMIGLVILGAKAELDGADVLGMQLGGFAVSAVYTWLMIVGLWGAFLHYFTRERAWVRYLADASYWCYLVSITPIILLQFWVRDWPLPGVLKFCLVATLTMAVLLASYEWCVRYTFIGAILNGRKYRMRSDSADAVTPTLVDAKNKETSAK